MDGIQVVPEWMSELEEEDVAFLKNFLLCSGSLKEIAGLYGVTYPTVRLRLDRIIQKVRLGEEYDADPYVALVKRLALNESWTLTRPSFSSPNTKGKREEDNMSIVASIFCGFFPALLLAALVAGLAVFLVVRNREKRRREEFQRRQAQAAPIPRPAGRAEKNED